MLCLPDLFTLSPVVLALHLQTYAREPIFFFTEIRIVQPDLFWFQHYTHFSINCMRAFGNTLARDFKNDSLLNDPNGSVKIKM